jgi:hypothetical protein
MMIVSLTRRDLRDEFKMADEAFALSPISARAVLPSEQDYDAISEAFMETSRGRWFLGEYAKRNRNSDTRMVLDAVSRIEETLAAQKQPVTESALKQALVSVRHAVEQAHVAASAAVDNAVLEENLAPVRKAARIIREISWRWREIGADGRICDLLDSQVGAIDGACGQIAAVSPREALGAAFDLIRGRIAQFEQSDIEAAEVPAATGSVSPRIDRHEGIAPAADVVPQTFEQSNIIIPAEAAAPTAEAEAPVAAVTAEPAAATEPAGITDPTGIVAEVVEPVVEVIGENTEADVAYDEALLEMVAHEMGAPDFIDIDVLDDPESVESVPPAPILVPEKQEPVAAPAEASAVQASLQPSLGSLQPSLGSTLIANGIVGGSNPPLSDPLAPIRRMSQAEKIAFFS